VERAGVHEESVAGSDFVLVQARDVAVDEGHLDTGLADALLCALKGPADVVHSCDQPATLRQLDSPNRAAAAEVHGPAVRRGDAVLLAGDHSQ
jgi:hypothetical protein